MKEDIAIVGMGGIFPDAMNFSEYWSNILRKKDSIREIPDEFWSLDDFYDPDSTAEDKTYSKVAGTVGNIEFDTCEFGIPPKVLQSISVEQIYSLIVAKQALLDANMYGKESKTYDAARTGVIMAAELGSNLYELHERTEVPSLRRIMKNSGVSEQLTERVLERFKSSKSDWDEACNPGYLANVVAGRIANRFNLGGTCCCVNAACGSGLAAVEMAVHELLYGNCDIMLAGGANLSLSPNTFISFSKTPALSKKNQIRPFDANADGMVLGDGVGIVVLKRRSDAERDHDRIYAVIKGIGNSSDGKAKSIFSPSKDGQIRAINNALQNSGISKESISLIEAHGTGTVKGDACEAEALSEVFAGQKIVMSSVKSQIGHLRLVAGIASLIKTAFALYHKTYPSTINIEKLNPTIEQSSLYVLKDAQPWIVNNIQPVRRAGVSAFGFGGTNFHAILEEAQSEESGKYRLNAQKEEVVFAGDTKEEMIKSLQDFLKQLESDEEIWHDEPYKYHKIDWQKERLVILAENVETLKENGRIAIDKLSNSIETAWEEQDIFYRNAAIDKEYKTATLFSGQGQQKTEMFRDLACAYPEFREMLSAADNIRLGEKQEPISSIIYPLCHNQTEKESYDKQLMETRNTQIALAVMEGSLYQIAKQRGFQSDLFIGHSFGELVALYADQVFNEEVLLQLSMVRGKLMSESVKDQDTGMVAVFASESEVKELISQSEEVYLANKNSQKQIIIAGNKESLRKVQELASSKNIRTKALKVSAAFHTPYMDQASKEFRKVLSNCKIHNGSGKVIANWNGEFYTKKKKDVVDNLAIQVTSSVEFQKSIEKAYSEGVRVFVEIGPGNTLSKLVADILADKEVIIIPINKNVSKDTVSQMEKAFARMYALGMDIKSDPYRRTLTREFKNRKTPTSYTINPIIFHLDEKKERIKDAINRVDIVPRQDEVENRNCVKDMDMEMREIGENEDMSEICKLREINANVFERFLDVQNQQMRYIGEVLEKADSSTEKERTEIIECIKQFQLNSLKALECYFGQNDIAQCEMVETVTQVPSKRVKEREEKEVSQSNAEERKSVNEPVQQEVSAEKVSIEINEAEKQADSARNNDLEKTILEVISKITGYPVSMFTNDMELESELGIDSIKRMEIFSEINDVIDKEITSDDIEELSLLATIQEVIDYIEKL